MIRAAEALASYLGSYGAGQLKSEALRGWSSSSQRLLGGGAAQVRGSYGAGQLKSEALRGWGSTS